MWGRRQGGVGKRYSRRARHRPRGAVAERPRAAGVSVLPLFAISVLLVVPVEVGAGRGGERLVNVSIGDGFAEVVEPVVLDGLGVDAVEDDVGLEPGPLDDGALWA